MLACSAKHILIVGRASDFMDYISLGKTGERLSEIGLGTWKLGVDEKKEIEALEYGLDSGINFIDTAEMYGTEPLVAKAIRKSKDTFIATKVSPTHFRHDEVIRACEGSLQRLGIKTIDLYQLHWPNKNVPIHETMGAMERLVDDGRIRHIGVSNFSIRELEEAQAALKKYEIVSDQIEYSMLVRDIGDELLPFCKKEGISVIAYSPLSRAHIFEPKYAELTKFLAGIGERHGKDVAQVAINWLICKGNVIPIPKASSKKHVADLVGSAGWRLSKNEVSSINDFLSDYSRRSLASVAKPAINSHPFVTRALTWLSSAGNKK